MTLIATYLSKSLSTESASEQESIPWSTLKYLIGEAMYGGRVSDGYDRRILTTYLDEYFGDFIFDKFGRFWLCNSNGNKYNIPKSSSDTLETHLEAIGALPDIQSPSIFGLDPHADISYHTFMTRQLWTDLMELQTGSNDQSSDGKAQEDAMQRTLTDIQERLPALFDVGAIKKQHPSPSPTQLVLFQELDHWNRLVHCMRTSLNELSKALAGEVGFSSDLESLRHALRNGQLPSAWAKLSPQCGERPDGRYNAKNHNHACLFVTVNKNVSNTTFSRFRRL